MEIAERVKTLKRNPVPALIPSFGPLQGIRILSTGSIISAPFAGSLLADFGAEVIHVEDPITGDPIRKLPPIIEKNGKKISAVWLDNGRNKLSMGLDLNSTNPLAKEVFLSLIKVSDIWIENLGQTLPDYGITDKLINRVNPGISIIHVSGYGTPRFGGIAAICQQASSDITTQAYTGWNSLVGDPNGPPTRIPSFAADYILALAVCWGSLAGYIDARRRNKGQTFDCAGFEVLGRILSGGLSNYLNLGVINKRQGNKSMTNQPYGIYKTVDGYVGIGANGPSVYGRFIKALASVTGLNPDDFPLDVAEGTDTYTKPQGKELDRITTEWIASHTKKEVDDLFEKFEVPCAPVYTPEDTTNDPHWIKRDAFIEYTDPTLQSKVKSFGIAPKISPDPGMIWRGAPRLGEDTVDILTKILDYTPAAVNRLQTQQIICR